MKAEEVREVLKGVKKPVQAEEFLSTGSTLLNLACTGSPSGGFAKGRYFFMVGDSSSGKTFLSLTCLAEAALSPSFDNYRFIFDDVEGGALMSIERFFGEAVARRIEPPAMESGEAVYSQTIEEFYMHLADALDGDRPVIYILDSMDALSSDYEREKSAERASAIRRRVKARGDYGDGKAKRNSSGIRSQLAPLRDTGSILLILNQTRDNIGAGLFEPQKTRSGGHALTFYATLELWSSIESQIKRTVRDVPRAVGVNCRVRVRKNRITGRDRTVNLPIYYSYGIDDIGSCVDYLVEESRWSKTKNGWIDTKDDICGCTKPLSRSKLIRFIEEASSEAIVRKVVADVWEEVEAACTEQRKPRYS